MNHQSQIWKFPLAIQSGPQSITAPGLGKALFFAEQLRQPHAWMKVKPGQPDVTRRVQVIATGEPIPLNWRHVGSLQSGAFVWHLFQEGMA